MLVRLYLSWFSICRIIKLAKPISAATFRPYCNPNQRSGTGRCTSKSKNVSKLFAACTFLPCIKGFGPTWKSTPNDDRHFVEKNRQGKPVKKVNPNIFTSVKYEIGAFAQQLAYIHSLEGIFSPGILFAKGRILFPLDNK